MQTIFIFHGTFWHPEENRFPWLKEKLESTWYHVIVPRFPTPENQSLGNRRDVLHWYKDYINQDTIMIGHSLWALFALHLLEEYKVLSCILVAWFIESLGNETFDNLNQSFTEHPLEWKTIAHNTDSFTIYQSDDDPYIPLSQAKILSKKLHTPITLIKNAWHFNSAAWYNTFEVLYNQLIPRH